MINIRTIAVIIGAIVIAAILSFQAGKLVVEKEIIKEALPESHISDKIDIKTIVEEIKKLKEKVIAKENEYKGLKEEYELLRKKVESRENILQELTNELITCGIAEGLTANKETGKEQIKKSSESPDEIINELTKAINEGDLDKSLELWLRLLGLGQQYYPKALELYDEIDKEIFQKHLRKENVTPEETEKFKKEAVQYGTKFIGLLTSENVIRLGEWIIETKRDIKSSTSIENHAVSIMALINSNKAPQVYDYLKEKLSQTNTEEDIKKYSGIFRPIITHPDIQKEIFKDLANPVVNLKAKEGIAFALGELSPSGEVGKKIKEKFDEAISNDPYKQQLEASFEKGKEEGSVVREGITTIIRPHSFNKEDKSK